MADFSSSEIGSEDTDITQIEYRYEQSSGEFSLNSFIQISIVLSIFLHFFGICHEKIYHFLIIFPSSATTLKVLTDENTLYDTQRTVLRYWCFFCLFWTLDLFIPFNYVYSLGKLFLHNYFLQRVFRPNSLYSYRTKHLRTKLETPVNDYNKFKFLEQTEQKQNGVYSQ
ncbi:unnamed protein product [Auanema sp. JU1783]|nr:unnamed protein product [Auanema sp. JU1783]